VAAVAVVARGRDDQAALEQPSAWIDRSSSRPRWQDEVPDARSGPSPRNEHCCTRTGCHLVGARGAVGGRQHVVRAVAVPECGANSSPRASARPCSCDPNCSLLPRGTPTLRRREVRLVPVRLTSTASGWQSLPGHVGRAPSRRRDAQTHPDTHTGPARAPRGPRRRPAVTVEAARREPRPAPLQCDQKVENVGTEPASQGPARCASTASSSAGLTALARRRASCSRGSCLSRCQGQPVRTAGLERPPGAPELQWSCRRRARAPACGRPDGGPQTLGVFAPCFREHARIAISVRAGGVLRSAFHGRNPRRHARNASWGTCMGTVIHPRLARVIDAIGVPVPCTTATAWSAGERGFPARPWASRWTRSWVRVPPAGALLGPAPGQLPRTARC